MNREELLAKIAEFPYWYHNIDLGNGIVTPGWAPLVPSKYGIPDLMDGETVVDIGSWDGYWAFQSLKRGAKHVRAVEDFSDTCGEITNADRSKAWATFDLCAEALGYRVFDAGLDVNSSLKRLEECQIRKYNASIEWNGCFDGESSWSHWSVDRVFAFGLIYHLRNPLKAIQNCFDMLKSGGVFHCESAILDNITSPYTGQPHDENGCYAEFYPTNEFGRNQSNWWVPTLKCARAWLQAAGFVDIESWKLTDTPSSIAECRGFLRARKP